MLRSSTQHIDSVTRMSVIQPTHAQTLCVSTLQLDPDGVELFPFEPPSPLRPHPVSFLHTGIVPSPVFRRESTGVHLELPYAEVLQALRIKGYLQPAHRRGRNQYIQSSHKGDSYGPMVPRPHADILAYFNKRLHGLAALYACVANKGALRGVLFHVKQCVACTLANKYKLQSMGKVVVGAGGLPLHFTVFCRRTKSLGCA